MAVSLLLAACGSSDSTSGGTTAAGNTGQGGASNKLIIAAVPFQCGLNDFTKSFCTGLDDVKKQLPAGYTLQQKNTTDFTDTAAFTNLIRTSLQLKPAGLVVFNDGGPAQVPVLKQACAQGVKVILLDNAAEGLGDCLSSFIAANNRELGVSVGKWLIAHPPTSKEVGIVTQQPGLYQSARDRDEGFKETVEEAGYKVVATGITDLSPGKSKAAVTNMLTAHPSMGTIFSALDQAGGEAWEAVASHPKITMLSIDGSADVVSKIQAGPNPGADAAQAPRWLGTRSVLEMVKLTNGQQIPKVIYEPSMVVDKGNAANYLAQGGLK
jgi:ABC-type sugar transport system substrate-binding protein